MVPGERRLILAQLYREPLSASRYGDRYDRDLEAVIAWPFKLVRSDAGTSNLFELAAAGLRETPHADVAKEQALARVLDATGRSMERVETQGVAVDEEVYEALRELGYVE